MQFRLMAGTHVGPDSHGVMRMWTAKSGHDIIDTHQDLSTLNTRGFPPKFQPMTASPHDEAALLSQKAEIETRLAEIARDKAGETVFATAPAVGIPSGIPSGPPEVQMLKDPRDAVTPQSAARDAKNIAAQNVLAACERMDEDELRGYCEAEEIVLEDDATKADMLAAIERTYA